MKNPFITKEGKNYQLYYYIHGNRTKITTGTPNRKLADKFLADFIANGLSVIEYQFIRASVFCSEYLDVHSANLKPKSAQGYRTAFNELIKFSGDKNLNQFTLSEINRFLSNKSKSASPWSARKYRTALRTAFEYALKLRYIRQNLFEDAITIKTVKPAVLQYTDEELRKLFSVIDNPLYKDIVVFGFYSGMRLDEILRIELSQIHRNLIILPTAKEDRPRVVSIATALKPIITKYQSTSTRYLFEFRGNRVLMESMSHIFSKYVRRAGINPKLNFHCLRKTYGSRLLESGVDIKVVSEMLGHSSVRVTEEFYAELLKKYRSQVNNLKLDI